MDKVGTDYPNAIGNETDPVSISGVALWLADYAHQKN
jgi:hypothetical protein